MAARYNNDKNVDLFITLLVFREYGENVVYIDS